MKLILMGTNDFVVPVFDDLANKHDIIAVFTRAPKPMGRKHILTPSPVHRQCINGRNHAGCPFTHQSKILILFMKNQI